MPSLARALPLDKSFNLLKPIISTREYPHNLCALKIVTELARAQGSNITDEHLASLMTGVSPVRIKKFELTFYNPVINFNFPSTVS